MNDQVAIYLDKIVDKKNFRVFVYGFNNLKMLVETWEAYQSAMKTGLWFAKEEDVKSTEKVKSKRVKKELINDELKKDDDISDKKDEDFWPK